MSNFNSAGKAPGVYIDEQPVAGPIAGVSTSVVAFVGLANQGIAEPTKVTNWTQFEKEYGTYASNSDSILHAAVRGFYDNGGTVAYIVRAGASNGTRASGSFNINAVNTADAKSEPKLTQRTLKVQAATPGVQGNSIQVKIDVVKDARDQFNLTISRQNETKTYEHLSLDKANERYFGKAVNDPLVALSLDEPKDPALPQKGEKLVPKDDTKSLADGRDPSPPPDYQAALASLKKHDEISLVCAPGADLTVQLDVLNHCKDPEVSDRFAIMDVPKDAGPNVDIASVKDDKGWGAIYYPWIGVAHPTEKDDNGRPVTVSVPPSGHIAGIYARSDNQRGVHKAPANEIIEGALKVKTMLTDAEQGHLNDEGVNCIRVFPGDRPRVWGARTTSSDTAWRYINVKRLLLYVEESIQEGIRWAVFEPNDTLLWKKLERTITEFLTRVWQSGALFGRTAKEAFYVKIDEELNPPDVRALGRVNIEVGIAPVRPAEFVVVSIGMWEGGARITEL